MAADTSRDAHAKRLELLHRLTPAERLRITCQMSDDARSIARAGIAARHPELDDEGRSRELIRLMYGVEVDSQSAAS